MIDSSGFIANSLMAGFFLSIIVWVICIIMNPPEKDEADQGQICPGCKNSILPDVCWCGDLDKDHNAWSGHPFVPMGCDCMRSK